MTSDTANLGGEIPPTPSCETCVRAPTCRVLAGFARMMSDFKDPPVDAAKLAVICKLHKLDGPVTVKFKPDVGSEEVHLHPELDPAPRGPSFEEVDLFSGKRVNARVGR